ncbi:MAG: thioredoxin [Anaerolineales bacterium]|nr:thioredoxin [Anaerolineales bacterium]
MADIYDLSEGDFEREVLQSTLPVMVDFTAVWCGPCKMLDPVVKQLAQEWAGRVRVAKLDVDNNSNLAMQYGVMGVPTLMLFVRGQPVQRITGYMPKNKILDRFGEHI